MQPTFYVWAKWDDEAQVWYTAETSIRGLNSSGSTLEELRQRLLLLIPDFLEDQMPAHAGPSPHRGSGRRTDANGGGIAAADG